jgi:glycosyltransferase involved in cell wall biosynthesis
MSIAVLLPCYNESATIVQTIAGFRSSLPNAKIYVCDNGSTDDTATLAQSNGAIVINEPRAGKGQAMRRLFAEVDAEIYVMSDGDSTYDATAAPNMVAHLVDNNLDMVIGNRLESTGSNLFRSGHRLGNKMFSLVARLMFASQVGDLLSGYRVMSRRFVKCFPAESHGFEIESELTIHALECRLPIAEVDVAYFARPAGSDSKLSTFVDGLRILRMMTSLFRDVRPFQFFALIALITGLGCVMLFIPIFQTYMSTGTVPQYPTLIVLTGLLVLAFVFVTCGIVLDRVSATRRYQHRLNYLRYPRTNSAESTNTESAG